MFDEILRQFEQKGLILKRGTLIDASFLQAAARPPAKPKKGEEASARLSADADARGGIGTKGVFGHLISPPLDGSGIGSALAVQIGSIAMLARPSTTARLTRGTCGLNQAARLNFPTLVNIILSLLLSVAQSVPAARMGRNYLTHATGDAINAVLAAVGFNFSLLLNWLRLLCAFLLAAISALLTQKHQSIAA